MESSVIYSMGTALGRAHDSGSSVEVLVGGSWLTGSVLGYDGHGVVLETDPQEHVVIRMEAVSAVRVHARVATGADRETARPAPAAPADRTDTTDAAFEETLEHGGVHLWPVPAQASAY